ncbi:MAG TPA: TonB-dependent receptor, partial [Thermoanaerobaculia bacterium]|nr:TonB-dependent receptor [Thermoanaerobaculia bacterium]
IVRRSWRRIGCGLLLAALLGFAEPAFGAVYEGRPLAEVLLSLQKEGLAIVFTSELVRPEMKVMAEPVAREPRRVLDEILAPHGLRAEEGVGGVLVIVAAPERSPREASIEGAVLARGSGRGLGDAVVRVVERGRETRVREDGSFSLTALEPGDYTLEAGAPGYLDQQVRGVAAGAGSTRRVVFRLHPQPYIEDEIVVRASRLTLLDEPLESSFSLGREEIESLPHLGGDIFRATSLLPGVAANDVTAQLSIHGGRRDEVKIVLDGQELYGAFHLKDYDNALSLVPARILAGASLTTGAYPASQGDRMSGVLDLRTVDPPDGRQLVLGVSVLDILASSSGRFPEGRGAWLATGRRGSIDLASDVIGDEDPRFWDALGKVELATGLGLLTARVLAAGDSLGVDKEGSEEFERLDNEYRSTYGWLTHQATRGDSLLVETIGSWARIETDRGSSASDEEAGYELHDRRDLDVASLSQTWSLELGPRHLPRWGFEARRYDAFFDYAKDLEPEVVVVAPFSPPRRTEHRFLGSLRGEHLGAWVSDRVSWLGRLTAEVGARYDRHTATDDTLLSPRVSLGWRLGERSVVRAAWGRFYQSQRPYELQVEDGESVLWRAERSEHRVLGYERFWQSGRLGVEALRVELFDREIEDPRARYESLLEPVNFFPEIEPDRVRIAPERSTARGIEILLRGRRGARFDWSLAYSHARAEDRLSGNRVPRSLDQPDTGALGLNFRLPRQWNLNLAWRYHTGWPTTPVEAGFVIDPEDPEEEPGLAAVFGRLNSERLPAYHRLDLRASRRWDLRSGRLTFFVDVQNVYNRRNLAGFDVTLDEDAGVVELEEERWPGLFPSLGITWEL